MLDEKVAQERYTVTREGIRQWSVMMVSAGVGIILMALITSLWWPAGSLADSAGQTTRRLTTPGIWFMPIGWSIALGYIADLAGWPVFRRPLPMPWRVIVNFGIGIAVGAWFVRGPACRLGVLDAVLGLAWMGIVILFVQLVALAINHARLERGTGAGKSAHL